MVHNSCPICGSKKNKSTTTVTVDYKKGVAIIREVPALVCDLCGEEWITDSAAEKIEEIVSLAKKQNRE